MKTETPDQNSKLKILYEDEYLIIANKPVGLPVQPDKTEDESLFDLVKKHSKKEPHLLTRLDRVVSGATLFALDKEVAKELSFFMINKEIKKEYLAVTATAPEEKKVSFFNGFHLIQIEISPTHILRRGLLQKEQDLPTRF